jgi:hypothetical protein
MGLYGSNAAKRMKNYLKDKHDHDMIHKPKSHGHRALIIWCTVFFGTILLMVLLNSQVSDLSDLVNKFF